MRGGFHPRQRTIPSPGFGRWVLLLCLLQLGWAAPLLALPKRLILALDGVAYRDLKALQDGVTYTNAHGRRVYRQAFRQGFFPVSRLISSFPSTSDVAWTEIYGNRPLPGYQRTYFCQAANVEVFGDGVSSSMEYEKQMTWRVEGGFRHAMGYVLPQQAFHHELRELVERFLDSATDEPNYYAFMLSTDDAQHLSGDIFAMLGALEEKLQELQSRYRARAGRELEILILSDHGNTHAGSGRRVAVRDFLKKAGYRIRSSLDRPGDVVLPTAGIESWVELHVSPVETEPLLERLVQLEGVDILTARMPGSTPWLRVLNATGARARLEWKTAPEAFRYVPESGDPLNYGPVLAALTRGHQLDGEGYASAEAWMAATLTHRYPLALERLVRAHTSGTLNPASILISLQNPYVHADWCVKQGSSLVTCGGTHGGLDDLNSTGILLSNFHPTQDTSSRRVAGLFEGFAGLRDYRATEPGAEWVCGRIEALTPVARGPLGASRQRLPADQWFLRIWTPRFRQAGLESPVALTVAKIPRFSTVRLRRGDPPPQAAPDQHLTLARPTLFAEGGSSERVYALPGALNLEPLQTYEISGGLDAPQNRTPLFKFIFRADRRGQPVPE